MYEFVISSPGQGVQRTGMLDDWLAAVPDASAMLSAWSELIGFDLVEASHDENLLADTAVAQPLIVATAILSLTLLRDRVPLPAERVVYAGHSVGELAAAVGAGFLDAESAVGLARERGRAMSNACDVAPTGMAAVMPSRRDPATDDAILAAVAAAGLVVANRNGSHQFVAAGPSGCVERFVAEPPRGMRITHLQVAGAFHTEAMAPARSVFADAVAATVMAAPESAMVGNGDGALIESTEDLRDRLVAQVTSPVRWDRCSATLEELAVADPLRIELAPAGPLTRLAERAHPGLRAVPLRTPADVERVQAVVRAFH